MRAAELAAGVAVVAVELRDSIAGCAVGVEITLELVIEALGCTSWLFDPALVLPVEGLAVCVATSPVERASMLARAFTARRPYA